MRDLPETVWRSGDSWEATQIIKAIAIAEARDQTREEGGALIGEACDRNCKG